MFIQGEFTITHFHSGKFHPAYIPQPAAFYWHVCIAGVVFRLYDDNIFSFNVVPYERYEVAVSASTAVGAGEPLKVIVYSLEGGIIQVLYTSAASNSLTQYHRVLLRM